MLQGWETLPLKSVAVHVTQIARALKVQPTAAKTSAGNSVNRCSLPAGVVVLESTAPGRRYGHVDMVDRGDSLDPSDDGPSRELAVHSHLPAPPCNLAVTGHTPWRHSSVCVVRDPAHR